MIPIILPLIAVLLPVTVIRRADKRPVKDPFVYSVLSMSCTLGALLQEIFTVYRRIMNNDFAAVEDTIGAVVIISIVISIVSIGLNFMSLLISYGRDKT